MKKKVLILNFFVNVGHFNFYLENIIEICKAEKLEIILVLSGPRSFVDYDYQRILREKYGIDIIFAYRIFWMPSKAINWLSNFTTKRFGIRFTNRFGPKYLDYPYPSWRRIVHFRALNLKYWWYSLRCNYVNDINYHSLLVESIEKSYGKFDVVFNSYLDQLTSSDKNYLPKRNFSKWHGLVFTDCDEQKQSELDEIWGQINKISFKRPGFALPAVPNTRMWPEMVNLKREFRNKRRGRKKKVVLVGHISERKNLNLFLEVARVASRLDPYNWEFEICGEVANWVGITEKSENILKAKYPYYYPLRNKLQRMETEEELNELIASADFIWLLYKNHEGTSNLQFKAAHFGVCNIVQRNTTLERMGKAFGRTIGIDKMNAYEIFHALSRDGHFDEKTSFNRMRFSRPSLNFFENE